MVEGASGVALDRRHLASRRPFDRKKQRITIGLIAALMLIVFGILVSGYVVKFVLPPRRLLVRVNEVEYTRGDLVKLLQARQATVELLGGQLSYGSDVVATLQSMIENEIISQSAPSLGVTVSNQEVDDEIRRVFMSGRQGVGPVPPEIPRESRERYTTLLNRIQLSEAEHWEQVRKSLLRERFRQLVGEVVPSVAEQVHLHRVLMRRDDEIDVMQSKLKDLVGDSTAPEAIGRAVKEVVREFSRDTPDVVRKGGDLGWVPRGVYRDYEDVFFDLVRGELSRPVQVTGIPGSFYLFAVSEREVARPLDSNQRDVLKTRALQTWLYDQRGRYDVEADFDSDVYSWVVEQMQLTTMAAPMPEPGELDRLRRSFGF